MPKLGERLLSEGICTVEQLKAAVENQVIMGGRIGTNLLYCDNGHRAHAASDIGELLILSQHIARCYEAMFKRKWVERNNPLTKGML